MVTCFTVQLRCQSLLKERKKIGNLLFDESQNILDLGLKNSFAMTSSTLQKSSDISVQYSFIYVKEVKRHQKFKNAMQP